MNFSLNYSLNLKLIYILFYKYNDNKYTLLSINKYFIYN